MASSPAERPAGHAEQVYISAACSRKNATAARPHDGLVAFASGRLIALWKSAVRSPSQLAQEGLKADEKVSRTGWEPCGSAPNASRARRRRDSPQVRSK